MLTFRIYYISIGGLNDKVLTTAGGRVASNVLYNSKGIIYDRNLNALSGNCKVYYLIINPRTFDVSQLEYLAFITKNSKQSISAKLKRETPFVLYSYQQPIDIDGVTCFEGVTRYHSDSVCKHLIGYLDNEQNVGVSGIEKSYNDFLSKYSSSTTFSYSANAVRGIISGLKIDVNKENDTQNGIVLSLDKELSIAAEKALKSHVDKGCVIILNCDNGELLTISSTPDFNVNNVYEYTDSSGGELINNALTNQTVGSVFKMVIASIAYNEQLDNFEYECKGAVEISKHKISCQNKIEHGKQTLTQAFSNSCNCYFISLGQLIGYDKIIDYCRLYGIDSSIKLANDIYSDSAVLPKDEGSVALANLSIGQGKLMISPLVISRLTALMCNGGYLINPTVYKGTYIDGVLENSPEYSYKNSVLSNETSDKMKSLLIDCVENGTGKKAKPENNGAGGKTASAQTGRFSGENEILNTYFTGFYPADNPKYVITVFAFDGESGSKTCAPVFKEICDYIN